MRRGTAVSALALVIAAWAGCKGLAATVSVGEVAKAHEDAVKTVHTYAAAPCADTREVTVAGNILPNRQVALGPKLPGRIVRITKQEGDPVTVDAEGVGEVLVELDPVDILFALKQAKAGHATALAAAAQARTALENAQTTYRRLKRLYDRKALPEAELEQVVLGSRMASAAVKAAQANARMAEVGVETAQSKLADTILRAPFAGRILKRLVDEGEEARAMPPTIVLVLGETDPVKVEGGVSELEMRHLRESMPVDVMVDAYPEEVFEGKLHRIGAMVDPVSRTIPVRILIENPAGRLRPGMAARIRIPMEERELLAIPRIAILDARAEKARVFVVNGSEARERAVVIGKVIGDKVQIRSGLFAGEVVVTAGLEKLVSGATVDVVGASEELPRKTRDARKETPAP